MNMWHGMPFKKVGGSSVNATFTLATSSNWSPYIAEAFKQPERSILPIGLPRNDVLRQPDHSDRVRRILHTGSRKLAVWLPTFRATKFSDCPADGVDFGNPFNVARATTEAVERLAEQSGTQIIMKPHPYAMPFGDHSANGLHILSTETLHRLGISLYQLLAACDVLLTDYSSAWIDFLLTGKPIIFTAADVEAYRSSRGFTLNPPLEWLPGPIVTSLKEIGRSLESVLHDESYDAQRRIATSWHHGDPSKCAADRLVAAAFQPY